ncbi:MAG: hypothetical protein ABI789_01185 [Usitatibacter sp.]
MNLLAMLPDLERDMESALLHIGRGDIVDQLRVASVERWEYDEFADTASIFVSASASPSLRPGSRAETVSIYDELGVIVETDDRGCVSMIEISGGKDLIARLETARMAGAAGRR